MPRKETIVEVMPEGSLEVLSQHEVDRLRSVGEGDQHEILRRCALAVLNPGSRKDNARDVLEQYAGFDVRIVQQERGIKLALTNAPVEAFVDGEMIRGIRELLFAVVRDVVFVMICPPKTRPSPVLEFGRVKTRKGRAQWPHQRG